MALALLLWKQITDEEILRENNLDDPVYIYFKVSMMMHIFCTEIVLLLQILSFYYLADFKFEKKVVEKEEM